MKTNFKRIGRQTISVVLAVMMMVSTMFVGTVTSNAATVASDGTGVLYFNMNAKSWWTTSGTPNGGNFAHFYNSSKDAWSTQAVKYNDTGVYYVIIPEGNWDTVELTRNENKNNPADKIWNKTGRITLQSSKNYIKEFDENSADATFESIVPKPTSYSLSADKNIVNTNETVTLTPSITSNLVSAKSNAYTVKKDGSTASSSDYSINGNSITFNNTGSYTISDTITYNANGYSDIVGTVTTDEVNVTVSGETSYQFYLTGYIQGKDVNLSLTTYPFEKASDGLYTFTFTPTTKAYVTVSTTNTTYRPASYENLTTENTYSSAKVVTSDGDKWGIDAASNKEIKLTWNITDGVNKGKLKWEYVSSKHSVKLASGSSENATVKIDNNDLPKEIAEGDEYTLTVAPNEGYFLTKVTVGGEEKEIANANGTNTYNLTMGNADVEVKVEAAEVFKPVIKEITAANEICFGNSISITADDNTDELPNGITATKEFTVSPDSATIENGQFSVPKVLGETNDSIKYTVTYTVTLSNGQKASATKEITAKDSPEQKAYKTLNSNLGATYPNPTTLTDKTPTTLKAYTDAYNKALAVLAKGYPASDGTENTEALKALETAYNALKTITVLKTPVLGAVGSDASSITIASNKQLVLKLKNENEYTDEVAKDLVFTVYKEGQKDPVGILAKDKTIPIDGTMLSAENTFYIVASSKNSDYKFTSAQSEYFTVNVVPMFTITVAESSNGSVKISSYYDINGVVKSTDDSTVDAMADKNVGFTVIPEDGYVLKSLTVTDANGNPVAAVDEEAHTYTMPNSNIKVTAVFSKATYTLTYTAPTGKGVESASISNEDAVEFGTQVTVTVVVKDKYSASLEIENVDVTTAVDGNTYTFTFTMPANAITVAPKVSKIATVTNAVYLKNTDKWDSVNIYLWYTGTQNYINNAWPGGVMKSLGDGVYSYELDSTIDPTLVSFIFSNKGSSKTGDLSFSEYNGKIYDNNSKLKEDEKWSDYVVQTKYSVTVNEYDTAKGNVTVSPDSLLEGETFTVTAVPVEGYSVETITVIDEDGDEVTKNDDGSYTMPACDVTVTVTFKVNSHTLTFTEPEGVEGLTSTISKQGDVEFGTKVTLTVTVPNGFEAALDLGNVEVEKTVVDNQYTFTFTMPNNGIVVAPTVSGKGVPAPVISLGAAVATGGTMKAFVNEPKSVIATVGVPEGADASYVTVDETKTGYVTKVTYTGADGKNEELDIDTLIVPTNVLTTNTTTFKFDKVGKYLITYNGTLKSTVDATKTASANATLTVDVTYSATQQAYLDLKALVDDTTNYPESVSDEQYTSGVNEYNTARANAAAAVTGDLPAYDAEDTFTALKEALVDAKNKLVAKQAFYIGGQFKAGDIENNVFSVHPTGKDDKGGIYPGQEIKFEPVTSTLYKVETNRNITDNNGNYFFVYSKSGTFYRDYGAPVNTNINGKMSLSNSQTITNTGWDKHLLYLQNAASAPNAVIWLDTSGLNNDGTGSMRIFYTSGNPEPKYSITGGDSKGDKVDWASDWNTYSDTNIVNGVTENPFVFQKTIVVTDTTSYFRLTNGNTSPFSQYGPNTDQTEITSVKAATIQTKNNAFKIKQGSYRLFVDQSGDTPVIWAMPADYNVSAIGTYTYNGSKYDAFEDGAAPKVTISSPTVSVGQSVTVTADAEYDENYKFVGWVTQNGSFADSSAYTTTFTPNADNAIAIARYAKKVTVDVQLAEGSRPGTWTTLDAEYLLAGSNLSITFTPDNADDIITSVTVEGKEYVTSLENNTLNFTVGVTEPDYNEVFIRVTFAERPRYNLNFDYATGSDNTMGTLNCYYDNGTIMDEGSYLFGTLVTFQAAPKEGYVFKGWYSDINGTGDCLSTNTTYTFTLEKDTDVFAKFAEDTGTQISGLYLIYSDTSAKPSDYTKYLNIYYDSNNEAYAYFDSSIFDDSKEYRFMISKVAGKATSWESAYDNYNSGKNVNYAFSSSDHLSCGKGDWWLPKAGTDTNVNAFYAKFKVLDEYAGTVSSVKVKLGYYNGTDIVESADDPTKAYSYEVIPNITGTVSQRVKVYAKDGTIRTDFQKYADMADTKMTWTDDDVIKAKESDYTHEGFAKLGSTITITTTMKDAYKDKYFVKAFSVNGYSYGIIDSSQAYKTNGVYSFNYTIPEDCTDNFIEITPIYYYIDVTDTVTFYVEGFDETVQAKWGNTVAVQAWYLTGEDKGEAGSKTKNALGGYPGQPLVYEGGKYSMQIPKYLNGDTTNKVSGITLNNYIWDDIHKGNFNDQVNDNAQTYDFDDFYKLSDTKDVDNIIFDFRYRTTTDNIPAQTGLSDSTYNKSELEPLKDYYGNIVDLFGNVLSEDWTTDYDSQYLTVISDGYVNNYIGTYATEWSVYDHDGNYITSINSSNLIDENKVDTTYQPAYNKLKAYSNLPVKIAYEKSIFGGNNKGDRADGRWYFSKKAQKITANVQIQYRTDDNSPFVVDSFAEDSNVGTETGTKAYFTNDGYNGAISCEGTVDGGNFSVKADTDTAANYFFIGWYLKTSDGYSFITGDSAADIPMTNNETYVARFIPTPSGTLTLSHNLLDGSAQGRTYISAKVVNPTKGNVVATIAETSGNLVLPSRYITYTSPYNVVVTLRTVPYGNDEVEDFYNYIKKPYNTGVTGTGEKTYDVTTIIKNYFEEHEDTDHNKSYVLKTSNIPFYSNITSKPLDYTITYSYKTRLNGDQSYVVKDTVSGMELQEMWAANEAAGLTKEQLSKTFITKKAPFVSNFREQIKWNIDNATINGYTATVSAAINTSDLTIAALTVNSAWTAPITVKYGEVPRTNGDYIYKVGTTEFPEKIKYSDAEDAKEYELSYWAIFDNRDSAQQFSNAVQNYMSKTPNEVMADRLAELSKLDGYKNLVAKSYSKEYNYVSYQNYFVVPVYADRFAKSDITEAQASIRLLEYTRNQWTNENGVKGDGTLNTDGSLNDYLYTDFALSFDKDQELIKNNANIKVGIAFEIVAKYDNVDLKTYVTDSDTDKIGSAVKGAKTNGKVGSYTFDGANRNIYRYEVNNSTISSKNRIEYYLQFKNTANARQNVLKVYSYIYDTQSGEIYLSDPVYMNMYDIGNLTYITSDLANINFQPSADL